MAVTREELERSIQQLRAEVSDPRAGLYGPDTVSWKVNREIIVFVAGGRAALLQLAHPFVAHAVDRHSETRSDPLGRFQRTFQHVYAMTFGDLDHAISASRRVYAIHQRISGTAEDGTVYDANDEQALLWVYATLAHSAILAFESTVEPLTEDEKDRYVRNGHRFAKLFGIPDALLHDNWRAFDAYMEGMYGRLRVTEPAREMAGFLLQAPLWVLGPVARWYRLLTTGLLPEPLRRGFGFRYERVDRLAFAASMRSVRALYRHLPDRARFVPAYSRALSRLDGKERNAPFAEWVERLVLKPQTTR